MSISLVAASAVLSNVVRVTFSEQPAADSHLFEKSNYVFRTRFGDDVPLYAKSVAIVSTSQVDVTLQDAMLTGGNYQLEVFRVHAVVDLVPIETNTHAAVFVGDGEPLHYFKLRKRIPSWLSARYGTELSAAIGAMAAVLDELAGKDANSALRAVADAMSVRTATGADLAVIGQNYGVDRPEFLFGKDDLYRQLIPIFAARRKAVQGVFIEAFTIILGDQATEKWNVYCLRANEITIELPPNVYFGLAPGTLASATYLHDGDLGASTGTGAGYLDDTTKSWVTDTWINAVLVDSALVERTITGNTATRLLVAGTPASGAYTILRTAAATYPGDYLLADSSVSGSTIDDNIVLIFQQTVITDIVAILKASGMDVQIKVVGI